EREQIHHVVLGLILHGDVLPLERAVKMVAEELLQIRDADNVARFFGFRCDLCHIRARPPRVALHFNTTAVIGESSSCPGFGYCDVHSGLTTCPISSWRGTVLIRCITQSVPRSEHGRA